MKKLLSLIVVLSMLISMLPAIPASAWAAENITLYLGDYPKAGQKPNEVTSDHGKNFVTFQEWTGNFDENGCFIAGQDYTLTAEFTIVKENFNPDSLNTSNCKLVFRASQIYHDYVCDIISLTNKSIKGKYVFHIDDKVDFQPDECGTGVAKEKLKVYQQADRASTVLGELQYNDSVKVIRAYVNGFNPPVMHMVEYSGKIGYINGRKYASDVTTKYLTKIKVDGKYDASNSSVDLTPDFGEKTRFPLSVGMLSFKAEYGTKPELIVSENSRYKVESIEYSTDLVTEKFSYVTALVTYVTLEDPVNDYYFKEDMEVKNGEVISRTDHKVVVKYSAFTGNGDKAESKVPWDISVATDEFKAGAINRPYAKAKVRKMGGNAKKYAMPHMASNSGDPGDEVYIHDETVNYRIPGLEETWVAVSNSFISPTVHFMPLQYLEEFEYLDNYMPGSPGNHKNTPYSFAGGTGTLTDPFLIQTAEQLNAMRYGPYMHYKLIADIDLSSWGNWVPIGGSPGYGTAGDRYNTVGEGTCAFMGSLDGNGHVVSGMQIVINEETPFMTQGTNTRSYGLFGTLATNPEEHKIKNLGMVNFNIDINYTYVDKTLDLAVSAFCGMNNTMDIYNCYTKGGKININVIGKPTNKPRVDIHVGGICPIGGGYVGRLRSVMHIEKCFNDSDITVNVQNADHYIVAGGIIGSMDTTHVHECYNSGNITLPVQEGNHEDTWHSLVAGGICGRATIPEIPGIYHKDAESSSYILNCYNTGTITSRSASGIFGFSSSDIHLENCYNTGKIVGNQFDNNNGYFTINNIFSGACGIAPYGTEYVRNCTTNGNAVTGSAWKSSSLGRKVLAAIPEDSYPKANYNFVTGIVGSFKDVKTDAYYADPVRWAVNHKITSGTSATTFSPDNTCTRAQILTFLWRAVGSPKATGTNPFTDVKTTDYYYDAALWAHQEGMVSGNKFAGDTLCTRRETVIYLWKYDGSPKSHEYKGNFTDVSAGDELAKAVAWALRYNITSGTSDTTFSPNDTCTRGQIATFLYRSLK